MTCLSMGMLCTAYAYAALPAKTNANFSSPQKENTLTETQIQNSNNANKFVGSTKPQMKDNSDPFRDNSFDNINKLSNSGEPQAQKIIYSSSHLTDAQKINEMSKMFNTPVYGTSMDAETMAVARDMLEKAMPYILPLNKIELNAGTGGGGGYGELDLGIHLIGDISGTDYRAFMDTATNQFANFPMRIAGPKPEDDALCVFFHEYGHAVSVGNDQFPWYLFEQYPNCRVTAYAGENKNECVAEFIALMYVFPEEMARYCEHYPDMNIIYTGVKKFFNDRGAPVPTKDLYPRRDI